MEIFFIRIDNFVQNVDMSTITKIFSSKKRCIEYSLGRFLTKLVAKNFYNIKNTDIIIINKKPQFTIQNLNFNISHSKNMVAVAFDSDDIGLDIEFIKPRNIEKFSKRFKMNFKTEAEFYQYWTCFEAQYKSKSQNLASFKYKNYMISISSLSELKSQLKMYEVEVVQDKINLQQVNNYNFDIFKINKIDTSELEFLLPLNVEI